MGTIKPAYTTAVSSLISEDETLVFRDGTEQWETSIRNHIDSTRMVGMENNLTLQQFFARPIKVASYVWDPAAVTPFFQNFNPWTLFFEDPNVINRMNNYQLLQATLKVKFVINGNSFYFGRLMADYHMEGINDDLSATSGAILANAIQASQRMHLFIDPCLSQAGTMHLPFVKQQNTMNLRAANWRFMGDINIRQLQPLKHSNGSTTPVDISVFVWSEDVKLSMPTSISAFGITPQAGDEYAVKPVSSMMTTIAKIAGKLESIPWITPYAKATGMVASGIGMVASAFGFSRPASIDNPTCVRRVLVSSLANTNRGDTCTKLTVDSKQEITVDPAVVGVDVEDELSIKHIAGVQSYITQFPFTVAAPIGQVLWNCRVSPIHQTSDGLFRYNPAMTFATIPFSYWRGSIKYRFQIVASAFHKGRLLVQYDPGWSGNQKTSLQYSRIIDLSNERDFTIEVCWGQDTSFLPVPALATNFSTTAYISSLLGTNGVLTVSVLNSLTSPSSVVNNDIAINVFANAADDFEVAVPNDLFKGYSYLPPAGVAPQAGDVDGSGMSDDTPEENAPITLDSKECVGADIVKTDNTLDVFFGESIQSFRQLLKRYMLHSVYPCLGVSNSLTNWNEFDFPVYRGFGPDARHVVTGPVNANIVNTTLLNYITPAFVAFRGSMRSKYMLFGTGTTPATLAVTRNNQNTTYSTGTIIPTNTNAGTFSSTFLSPYPTGFQGSEITHTGIQPAVEVEFPYYTQLRYTRARQFSRLSNGFSNLMHIFTVLLGTVTATDRPFIQRYISVGEDFSLVMFQGQPPYLETVSLVPT